MLKRLTALSFILLTFAACGDDKNPFRVDGGGDDIDAGDIDAGPDAEPAVTTHTATVSVLDVRVRTSSGAVDALLGSGGQVVGSFFAADGDIPGVVDAVGQIYDDRSPTTGAGCAAFVWDLTVPQVPPSDEGHGTVTITGSTAVIPPCNFVSGDYLCLGAGGTLAVGDSLSNDVPGGANTMGLTVVGATFTTADVGRFVKISGANSFRNNGVFPVVGFATATTLVLGNPLASTQVVASGETVTYQIIAGAGPVAGAPSPEFLADNDSITVALDAPASDPFEDYTTPATNVGDNFSLTPAANTAIVNIPVDGSAFTLGCDLAVFTHSMSATFNKSTTTDEVTITETGIGANVRVGAEVIITGATDPANNSPAGGFTITARAANTITYLNAAGVSESFAGGTTAVVNDCGVAVLTAVNIDFSDAALTELITNGSGAGPAITDPATSNCAITNTGMFVAGYTGASITITGTTNNNGTFPIVSSTTDTVVYTNAACAAELFVAASAYEVRDNIAGAATQFRMPDPATSGATKIGHIQCAALASPTQSVTVPAGASAALMMVDPARIRTVFVRGGLAQVENADGTNPSNIIAGHAVVGFTDTP